MKAWPRSAIVYINQTDCLSPRPSGKWSIRNDTEKISMAPALRMTHDNQKSYQFFFRQQNPVTREFDSHIVPSQPYFWIFAFLRSIMLRLAPKVKSQMFNVASRLSNYTLFALGCRPSQQ